MAKPSNINHLFKISEKTADLFSRRESFFFYALIKLPDHTLFFQFLLNIFSIYESSVNEI